MNVTAVITWFSAAGGLFLPAARLTGYTSGFQGAAAARLPVPVNVAGPAAGSAAARCGMGAMT